MIAIILVLMILIIMIGGKKAMEKYLLPIEQANSRGGWGITREEPLKELPLKKDFTYTIMDIKDFSEIVKRTINDTLLQKVIIAIALREQRYSKEKIRFPNNNVFGINLFKNGWKNAIHLVDYKFLERDSLGWVWFAGFNSIERCLKFMEIVLKSKGATNIKTPDDWAYFYVYKWWSPLNKEKALNENKNALISIWNEVGKYV
ncbi:MAG: hypothetical protein ACO2O6_06270 [Candidatus Hydrothermia bacterium]|jgi:hypothetical protein